MAEEKVVSVIICTRNRVADLERCLDSLDRQTRKPDEVLIVDASDDSKTDELIALRSQSASYPLREIRGPRGLTLQRNVGIEQAQGRHLYFFDDDVVLEPDYLAAAEATFARYSDQNVGGVCGRITNASTKVRLIDRLFKSVFALTAQGRGRIKASGFPEYRIGDTDAFIEVTNGCCMAFTAEVCCKHRFDEKLVDYSYMEDVDFSFRVSREFRLVYQPQARLEHNATTFKVADSRKLRRMLIVNHHYLYRKNRKLGTLSAIAHYRSILGILIYNSVVCHDLHASRGVMEGIWHACIRKQGPERKC